MPSSKQLIKPVYHKPTQTPIIEEETKLSNTSMSSFIVSVIRYVESSLYPKKLNSSLYSAWSKFKIKLKCTSNIRIYVFYSIC